jgi:sec-independent protein translocase protein TatB
MFDLAWSEILLIAVVAVVFIGPKELPAALRTFGKWTAKARQMAGEFQRNLDDMVREAELEDVKKQFDDLRGIASNPTGAIEKWVDPKGEIRNTFQPPTLDKPGLDTPAASDAPPAPTPAPTAAPAPVAEPVPVTVAAEAAAAPLPASVAMPAAPSDPAPPPMVAPPPAGAGAAVETKTPVTTP